jgi:D-alanyl-D-alanine carboxypeptidase (penicillin-binding protein 5/6)
MKKRVKWLLCAALCGVCSKQSILPKSFDNTTQSAETTAVCSINNETNVDLQTRAKSAILMDFSSNMALYSHKPTERLPIASMCKIMTLLLCFDAIEEGILHLDESVCISERAASMGGSQVFLEANAKYSVNDLMKSIVVCSANDSCVAMAERIAGSESLFVDKMNEKAKEIGANNTLYANCTGLPKEPQYSCAQDVAITLKNLLQHEKYYEYGKVWMDKFNHPEGRYTEITNTNKLVRFYDGCDGGKTGFTNEAGFCLAATAQRNNMRVISVVIGEESSDNRFQDVRTMFDYAFANYTATPIVEKGMALPEEIVVNGGKDKSVKVYPQRSIYAVAKRGEKANVSYSFTCMEAKAPLQAGQAIAELIIYKDGVEMDRVELLSAVEVPKATLLDRFREIAENWNK